MDIGKKIAEARAEAGLTQQALADKLFVSRDLVSKWEQGVRRPDHAAIKSVEEALSLPEGSIASRGECVLRELGKCLPKGADIPQERLSALISSFLRELPQKEAKIFMRKYYLLNTNAEIAQVFGMGQNQVRSRLSKTVKRLKEYIREVCENERR
ncbi:MAG: helix-turn-helix domain-containing protein [Clostridia bacterium]|nr:helix-turn-helix domain-containing protein [Clostridia bacterium]